MPNLCWNHIDPLILKIISCLESVGLCFKGRRQQLLSLTTCRVGESPRPLSLLTLTGGLSAVSRTTLGFENLLKDSQNSWKLFCLQLQFLTLKGCTLKWAEGRGSEGRVVESSKRWAPSSSAAGVTDSANSPRQWRVTVLTKCINQCLYNWGSSSKPWCPEFSLELGHIDMVDCHVADLCLQCLQRLSCYPGAQSPHSKSHC